MTRFKRAYLHASCGEPLLRRGLAGSELVDKPSFRIYVPHAGNGCGFSSLVPRLCWSLRMVRLWRRCERERTVRLESHRGAVFGCVLCLESGIELCTMTAPDFDQTSAGLLGLAVKRPLLGSTDNIVVVSRCSYFM